MLLHQCCSVSYFCKLKAQVAPYTRGVCPVRWPDNVPSSFGNKTFHVTIGIWRFITVVMWTRHWTLSGVDKMHCLPSHRISPEYVPILSSHISQTNSSSLSLRFSNSSCMHLIFSYMVHAYTYHSPKFDSPNDICWRMQITKLLIV
jgi:hypothetical protein